MGGRDILYIPDGRRSSTECDESQPTKPTSTTKVKDLTCMFDQESKPPCSNNNGKGVNAREKCVTVSLHRHTWQPT